MSKTTTNNIDVSECYADKKMMKDGLYCFWEGESCADNKFCYFKEYKRLQEKNEKLYKALEEIKEMLKKSMSLKSNAYNHFINVERAIDKIDEVLNDNRD